MIARDWKPYEMELRAAIWRWHNCMPMTDEQCETVAKSAAEYAAIQRESLEYAFEHAVTRDHPHNAGCIACVRVQVEFRRIANEEG